MNIILKENEWAEEVIRNKTIDKCHKNTLRIVARYYMDQGYDKKNIDKKLDLFIIQCNLGLNAYNRSLKIDEAIKAASKRKATDIDYIAISKNEMARIDSLKSAPAKRLAFTLLCLAKYWDIVNSKYTHWVHNSDCEIMKMANIHTSLKRQALLYRGLEEAGYVSFPLRVDSTKMMVRYADDEPIPVDHIVCKISDFRNLGYQYLKYHGEPYIECQNCGLTVKEDNPKKGRKQKYCKTCAADIVLQQNINSVMRCKRRQEEIEKVQKVGKNEVLETAYLKGFLGV